MCIYYTPVCIIFLKKYIINCHYAVKSIIFVFVMNFYKRLGNGKVNEPNETYVLASFNSSALLE